MKTMLSILGKCVRVSLRSFAAFCRAMVVLIGMCGITAVLANYTMTQGVGTTFASAVLGGAHFVQMLICDATTAGQCAAVNASGSQQMDWTTGSQAHTDTTSPVPCTAATTWNNRTGQSGTVATGCDASAAFWMDLGAVSGTGLGTPTAYGTPPTGNWPGVNAALTQLPGETYNTIAASQTAQALTGGGGGATGDYLSHCVVQPTTTAAGTVTILDNATTVFTFTTGTLSNLVPFPIPVGALSVSGAWKVTTGANETVTCVGKFH